MDDGGFAIGGSHDRAPIAPRSGSGRSISTLGTRPEDTASRRRCREELLPQGILLPTIQDR
jgi:hypothetical protein